MEMYYHWHKNRVVQCWRKSDTNSNDDCNIWKKRWKSRWGIGVASRVIPKSENGEDAGLSKEWWRYSFQLTQISSQDISKGLVLPLIYFSKFCVWASWQNTTIKLPFVTLVQISTQKWQKQKMNNSCWSSSWGFQTDLWSLSWSGGTFYLHAEDWIECC